MSEQLIKTLLDKRARAWSEAQDIRERAEREGRDLTNEEDQTFTRALDDVERLDKQVENEERAQRLEKVGVTDTRSAAPKAGAGEDEDDAAYERAFGAYLRRGIGSVSPEARQLLEGNFEEIRAQAAGSDAAGGFTVPEGFRNKLTETMKAYGGLLSLVDVITTTTGNDLPWPTSDDTGNEGAILDENTQVTEQDIVFGQRKLAAYMYTSRLVRVSIQLLQDSAFNLDTWLPTKLGVRIGRAVAGHVATGTGVAQPQGIVNVDAGTTGAVSATAKITFDDLVDLEHSVDPAYRDRARYALNDLSVALIRKLKDANNRMLWQPSLAPGVPSTINGRPYTVDNKLPAPAPGAKSIFFGDFKAGYTARNVTGAQVMRLAERYADFLQVGFLGFSRWDGVIDDSAAVKAFQHGAAA
ncbi:MAG TPA: phage major capsid protein [Nocardioidaceae bacterium]